MSQENMEKFKVGLEAWNRRDIDALLKVLDPEVEWHPTLPVLLGGEGAVYRGHDGARRWLRDQTETFAHVHIEVRRIEDLGDRILSTGRLTARGRASGASIESPHAVLVDMKNGKATLIRTYLDIDEALEAAGLRE